MNERCRWKQIEEVNEKKTVVKSHLETWAAI